MSKAWFDLRESERKALSSASDCVHKHDGFLDPAKVSIAYDGHRIDTLDEHADPRIRDPWLSARRAALAALVESMKPFEIDTRKIGSQDEKRVQCLPVPVAKALRGRATILSGKTVKVRIAEWYAQPAQQDDAFVATLLTIRTCGVPVTNLSVGRLIQFVDGRPKVYDCQNVKVMGVTRAELALPSIEVGRYGWYPRLELTNASSDAIDVEVMLAAESDSDRQALNHFASRASKSPVSLVNARPRLG
jgi:hypothetical protein